MIIKKIFILSILTSVIIMIFAVFFWDIPAPVKKIEKDLEVHRLNNNDKN
jgi:hypothetical protein